MRRALRIALRAGVVTAGLAVACSGWIGHELRLRLNNGGQPFQVSLDRSGLFQSHFDSTGTMPANWAGIQRVSLRHIVEHGPLPLSFPLRPVLARARTALVEIAPLPIDLHSLFGPGGTVTLVSDVGLTGASRHRLQVPPMTLDQPLGRLSSLKSAGLLASAELAATGLPHAAAIRLAESRLTGAGVSLHLHGLRLTLEPMDRQHRLSFELDLSRLDLPRVAFSPIHLEAALNGAFDDALAEVPIAFAESPEGFLAFWLQSILARQPALNVSRLEFTTTAGSFRASASLSLRPARIVHLGEPLKLLYSTIGSGSVSVSVSDRLARQWLSPASLAQWLRQGFLRLDGGLYRTHAQMDDGRLLLNGFEVPLS